MLPVKIKDIILKLSKDTELGKYKWIYDADDNTVSLTTDKNGIRISYQFNTVEEVGQYSVDYSPSNGKEYKFLTNELFTDYEDVRHLYDIAQSSELDFDIDDDF